MSKVRLQTLEVERSRVGNELGELGTVSFGKLKLGNASFRMSKMSWVSWVKLKKWNITCVLQKYFIHIRRSILEQFVMRIENDDGNFAIAQNAQFISLLHQPELSFGERHLTISLIGNPLDGNFFASHFLK